MRIIVFSDSHGDTRCMERAIESIGSFDAIIHLGDIERDVRYLESKYSSIPIYAVLGNNDIFFSGGRALEKAVELGGIKMYLCHGHTKGVRHGVDGVLNAAKNFGCRVALFGHTHEPLEEERDGILIFNPGSCRLPRSGKPSFGILEIEDGRPSSVVVDWVI